MNETTKLTKDAAQREIARVIGYHQQPDTREWRTPDGAACDALPDWPNDLGAAVRLLWELPEGWAADVYPADRLYVWTVGKPGVKWPISTPEQFAVACCAAFLTAHKGIRVEIIDET